MKISWFDMMTSLGILAVARTKLVIQLPGLMFSQTRSFGNVNKAKCFQKEGVCFPCTVNKMNFYGLFINKTFNNNIISGNLL